MAWRQTRRFDKAKGGTTKGYCLRNVRLGYSIASKYATATDAWNATQQHRNRNVPAGVDVPLYYRYGAGNPGHINVRLANGQVWSDGEIFHSIADYEARRDPVYLGWGESVNDVRVIDFVPDPKPSNMPPMGSFIRLIPTQTRTTYKAGTTTVAGQIRVTDNSFVYQVRGYDPKFPYRIIINSKAGGGNGVALALRYTNGALIEGWVQV